MTTTLTTAATTTTTIADTTVTVTELNVHPLALTGACETCCGWDAEPTDFAHRAVATCPTCGVASVEYAMLLEMDSLLDDMCRFDALGSALAEI